MEFVEGVSLNNLAAEARKRKQEIELTSVPAPGAKRAAAGGGQQPPSSLLVVLVHERDQLVRPQPFPEVRELRRAAAAALALLPLRAIL